MKDQTMKAMQMTQILAGTGGVTKKVAEQQLFALLGGIKDALAAGEEVVVTDNFKIHVDQRAARKGRNPKTGEEIIIPAHKVIKFKAYKHFDQAVNP